MMQKILITGSNGQLGRSFKEIAANFPNLALVFANKNDLDITNKVSIQRIFEAHDFDFCINTAAYTAVDRAEEESDIAELINVKAVEYLAEACNSRGVKLIHFSTDYVYAKNNQPFVETDATDPQSVYAQTKLDGEKRLLAHAPQNCVIRTSWVYAPIGHNFVNTMLRLGRERDQLSVVYDQVGTPTYAPDLAQAILTILSQKELTARLTGIFNFSNEGLTSWYDFAKTIFAHTDLDCKVLPIRSDQYPTLAKRPFYSVLDKQKFKETFGLEIPYWRDSLKEMLGGDFY